MRERFQDSNALAAISRRVREDAAAAEKTGSSGRREAEQRKQAAPLPPPPPPPPRLAVARPPPPQGPPCKRPPRTAPVPPTPPPDPWRPEETVHLVDDCLAAAIAGRADAASPIQAALTSAITSGRPLPSAFQAALARAADALGRSSTRTLPFIAAQVAADLLATGGPPPQPPATPPCPGAAVDKLAAHKAAFAEGIGALKGGSDPGLLEMSLAMVVGGVEEEE